MNRLTSSNCGNSSYNETFAYDGDGNFTTKSFSHYGYSYNYESNTNKLSQIQKTDYSNYTAPPVYFNYIYDYKGNVTTKKNNSGTTLFTASKYDHRNLPLQVWDRSSRTTYYSYDDGGNRIHKKVGNGNVTNEYYLRDHTGKEVAIYNITNNHISSVNLYGNGMIGYVNTNYNRIMGHRLDERYYYVNDHLGTPRLVLNEHSTISSGKDYYAFGKTLREINNGTEQKYDYTSKELDKETGLHYFGARYYDSDISNRWLSVDPLADLNPGVSPYNYAMNNPLRLIDPDGMDTLYFDSRGRYLSDQTRKGNGDHVGYYTNLAGNLVQFGFNDQSDAESIKSSTTDKHTENADGMLLTGISIGKNSVGETLTAINVYKGLASSPIDYAFQASQNYGSMDYVNQIGKRDPSIKTNVTVFDGVGYNNFDLGNYYWGKTMSYFGFSPLGAQLAAQAFEITFNKRLDHPTDQRAVGHGARKK